MKLFRFHGTGEYVDFFVIARDEEQARKKVEAQYPGFKLGSAQFADPGQVMAIFE